MGTESLTKTRINTKIFNSRLYTTSTKTRRRNPWSCRCAPEVGYMIIYDVINPGARSLTTTKIELHEPSGLEFTKHCHEPLNFVIRVTFHMFTLTSTLLTSKAITAYMGMNFPFTSIRHISFWRSSLMNARQNFRSIYAGFSWFRPFWCVGRFFCYLTFDL